jgi:hypothetical protein
VQPARLGVQPLVFESLGDGGGEGDDVVLHLRLDLLNAGDGKAGLGGNGLGRGGGNHAVLGQHGAGRRLHLSQQRYLFSSVQMRPIAGRV